MCINKESSLSLVFIKFGERGGLVCVGKGKWKGGRWGLRAMCIYLHRYVKP